MNDKTQKASMGKAFELFWKNYVNFSGKSSRSEYWWWYLWNVIITFVICIPLFSVLPRFFSIIMNDGTNSDSLLSIIGPILISSVLMLIYELASLLPEIAIMLRRLRDTGMSEQWVITLVVARFALIFLALALAPLQLLNFVLGIVVLILMIMPTGKFKKQA